MTGAWAHLLEALPVFCVLGAAFIVGCWYGLYLNVTHMHRMTRWACRVSDALDQVREAAK